jgi:hypothetical protein
MFSSKAGAYLSGALPVHYLDKATWPSRANIRLTWNNFLVTNALAYYPATEVTQKFSIISSKPEPGNTKGGSIIVQLTSCLTGLESAVWLQTNFCFYLQNRLIQTSHTGGQQYSDTSPFRIPWFRLRTYHTKFLRHFSTPFSIPCLNEWLVTIEFRNI